MADLPKIVIQRLQPGEDWPSHPVPDLLNAFIENAMNSRERKEVLAHLAQCGDCREIVALALPEQMSADRERSRANGRFSWLVLRWAAAAACVVVVGTAVTLHYESHSKPQETIVAQNGEGTNSDNTELQGGPSAAIAKDERKSPDSDRARDALHAEKKLTAPTSAVTLQDEKSLDRESMSQQNGDMMAARETASAAPPASSGVTNELMVPGRAKEAEASPQDSISETAGSAPTQKIAAMAASKGMFARLLPKWTLNSDGTLQRSQDAGKTWQTISVGNGARFRALAANELDIWVGGSNGALFHSSDAGEHWTQVEPSANGEVVSADIIGVEFPDPQHGRITTSAQETWTTDDAGASWQKQ